ncbi:hypothetical protein, conserved [Entamoeba dispar SAW760]|uniref:Doublecortin domain-containing protein n=1 Tax=Entamoeba dispar (strain ATCC PRA-260 / SAW760) TaxID=370354 RepID=B0ETE0_ENTDS|nr:uncharacterized protein EDI_128780 [Entamoeba dispar SAW760]EDR22125.1 hypothetical protein, conserved [Entamoeba dispar SAW760]|eukprot:EDR22125.1 hypothetical protein, conserved [Entamoeba dispar SAW760]
MPHSRLILSELPIETKNKVIISPLHTHICYQEKNTLKIVEISSKKETIISEVKEFITVLLGKNEGVVYYTKKSIIFHGFNSGDFILTESLNDEKLILHSTYEGFIVCIFRPYRVDVIGYNSTFRPTMLSPFKNYLLHSSQNNILAVITGDKKLHLFIPRVPAFSVTLSFLTSLPKKNRNSIQMTQMKLSQIDFFFQISAQNPNSFTIINEKDVSDIYISSTSVLCVIGENIKTFNICNIKEEPLISTGVETYSFIGYGGYGSIIILENKNIICYVRDVQSDSILRGMISLGFEKMWTKLVNSNTELQNADRKLIEFEDSMRGLRLDSAKKILEEMKDVQVSQALKITEEYYNSGVEKKMYYRDLSIIAEIGLACIVKEIHNNKKQRIMKYAENETKFIETILMEEDMLLSNEKQQIKKEENMMRKSGNFENISEQKKIGLLDGIMNGNIVTTMNKYGFKSEEIKEYCMKFVYQFIVNQEIKEAIHLLMRLGYKDIKIIMKELYDNTHLIIIRKEIEKVMKEILIEENKYINEYEEYLDRIKIENKYEIKIKELKETQEELESEFTKETMKKYGISYEQGFTDNIAIIPRINNKSGKAIGLSIKNIEQLNEEEKNMILREEGKYEIEDIEIKFNLLHGKIKEIEEILNTGKEKNIKEINEKKEITPLIVKKSINKYMITHPNEEMIIKAENEGINNELMRILLIGKNEIKKTYLDMIQIIEYLPIFCEIKERYHSTETPQQWMKRIIQMDKWNDENEEKVINKKINIQKEEAEGCEIKSLYETLMKIEYKPMETFKMPFPQKEIKKYKMKLKDYLSDKRIIEVIRNKEIMEESKNILLFNKDMREMASFIKEFLGDKYIRLNTLIKKVIEEDGNQEYKNIITIEELDKQENKIEFLKYLERRAEPINLANELRNYLANRWGLELSKRQIEIICENENLIELLESSDEHGYNNNIINKCVKENWPESPLKSHIEINENEEFLNQSIGVIMKGFCKEEESGLSYMNWIFEEGDKKILILRFFESAIVGKTLQTCQTDNIEEGIIYVINQLIEQEFKCNRIIEGFEFFDKNNPLTFFFKIIYFISIASFGEIIQLKKRLNEVIINKKWNIGTIENIIKIMKSIIIKFIKFYLSSPELIERLLKELLSIEKLPKEVIQLCKERKEINKLIDQFGLKLKRDCQKEEIVNELIINGEYIIAHSFAVEYVPNDIFLPIQKEIEQMIKKEKLKGKEKWDKINEIICKRTCRFVDAGKYFFEEAIKMNSYQDYERKYKDIANEMLIILNYSIEWLNKEESSCKEAQNMIKKAEKLRHIYEESKNKNIGAAYIEKASEESIYYLINRGDYSLAMIMNEKINCNEMKIFKEGYEFIINPQSYNILINEGIEFFEKLIKQSNKIRRGIQILKMRYLIIYKYYSDKSVILALIRDSTVFRNKEIDIINTICGINTLKKFSSKLTHWNLIFEETKEFINCELIEDKELVPILSRLYVDIALNVKPICITGYPVNVIKGFLGLLKDPENIIEIMLQYCSETENYFVLSECFSCCYIAGEIKCSSKIMKKLMKIISKRMKEMLKTQNLIHFIRFAVKTKTLNEFLIKNEEDKEYISLPKIALQQSFKSKFDSQQIIPSIEEKSLFENQIYYLSDLKDIQINPELQYHSNYEQIISDCYTILNTSMEGGLFYFEKANKIVQNFITSISNQIKLTIPISMWYPQFIEAMKCYARAIGFFRNEQEYYWANKSGQMIGILSLQIYFDNVQLIGLNTERALNQMMYFTSFDDAFIFANYYNLLEPLKWSKSLYYQCILNGNKIYFDHWLSAFVLDKPTLTDILEYHERNEKLINGRRKDSINWDYFISKVKRINPSLFYLCEGRPLTQTKIPSELKLMILNSNLSLDSLK